MTDAEKKNFDAEWEEYAEEAKANGIDVNQLATIPQKAILDQFPMENELIYALDANELMTNSDGLIIFMKADVDKEGNVVLKPLSDEENQKAIEEYKKFIELFGGND